MQTHFLKILSWNVHGDLPLLLADPDCSKILFAHDVCLLQETHLYDDLEDCLDIPDGFQIYTKNRPYREDMARPGGGVAILARSRLGITIEHHLSAHMPDILVAEAQGVQVICAYVPPSSSPWSNWTQLDPWVATMDTVARCRAANQLPILFAGDLNARTGHKQSLAHTHLTRTSSDGKADARGNDLLRLCERYDLYIANGTSCEDSSPGNSTSHQPGGTSVIDYFILSTDIESSVATLSVLTSGLEWSDHCPISLSLETPSCPPVSTTIGEHTDARSLIRVTRPPSDLDLMVTGVVQAARSRTLEDDLEDLYGPICWADGPPDVIYTDGVCSGRPSAGIRAGAGVHRNPGDPRNAMLRLPGDQTPDRAKLYAILYAITSSSPKTTLSIHTSSAYAVRSICYWAPARARTGWTCKNGDILRDIAMVIKNRMGRVQLNWVQSHLQNPHHQAATDLADRAAALDNAAPVYQCPPYTVVRGVQKLRAGTTEKGRKVMSELPEAPTRPAPSPALLEVHRGTHRNRARVHDLQDKNLKLLLEAPNDGIFWKQVRTWLDKKKRTPGVSIEDLQMTFEQRMNPPAILPPSFDGVHHRTISATASLLPDRTTDRTPDSDFSRPISVTDIEEVKAIIVKHPPKSARGSDEIRYKDVLCIPNDALRDLFQACVDRGDIPLDWLLATLVAILKRGKSSKDPNSYRIIGLESCLLKTLTLLIALRLRKWMTACNLLPNSQNGFRSGNRTNNNSFILRCAIEKARASQKPLFVCFVDFSNAFPWTNHAALWLKLHRQGVGGPMFDWLRVLYANLRYRVAFDDKFSGEFASLAGILAGDSISPDLWNVFIADFRPPVDDNDVFLDGVCVGNLEQADDMALFSTTAEGLQRKLDYLWQYAARNFILLNIGKTKMMLQGHASAFLAPRPAFWLNGESVAYCEEYTYVGTTFVSTPLGGVRMFARHYEKKAKQAHRVAYSTFLVESYTGCLPPREGKRLYTARVDPHLTSGAEVSPDATMALLQPLKQVQHTYLQRLLGLNPRCMRAFLFSETGLLPIAYRRMILALRFLIYLLSLPREHLAARAWRECQVLNKRGSRCWLSDLCTVLKRVPLDISCLAAGEVQVVAVKAIIQGVHDAAANCVESALAESSKGRLLVGRLHRGEDGIIINRTLALREYLMLPIATHRKALTALLLAEHPLAEARLRYAERRRPPIPREHRLCRFCKVAVEDSLHALFECGGSLALVNLRSRFWLQCLREGAAHEAGLRHVAPLEALHQLLISRKLLKKLAWLAHETLKIYEDTEMLVPDSNSFSTALDGTSARHRRPEDVLL